MTSEPVRGRHLFLRLRCLLPWGLAREAKARVLERRRRLGVTARRDGHYGRRGRVVKASRVGGGKRASTPVRIRPPASINVALPHNLARLRRQRNHQRGGAAPYEERA